MSKPEVGDRTSYVRTFPGKWPGVSEWIEVYVENYHGRWDAYGSVSFPNPAREQWNTRKTFPTRDEAAQFAAEFVLEAERLVTSVERGESPWMPHRAMATECRDAGAHDGRLQLLAASVAAGKARRSELTEASLEAEHEWYRAHDWRDFLDPRGG